MQKHVTQQQKNSQTGTFYILAGRGVFFGIVILYFGVFLILFLLHFLNSELFKVGFIISIWKFYFIAACELHCMMNGAWPKKPILWAKTCHDGKPIILMWDFSSLLFKHVSLTGGGWLVSQINTHMGFFAFEGNTSCHFQTDTNCWGEHLVCSESLLKHWKLQISIAGTSGMTRAGGQPMCVSVLCTPCVSILPVHSPCSISFPEPLEAHLTSLMLLWQFPNPNCLQFWLFLSCTGSHGNKKGKRSQFQTVFQWSFDQAWNPEYLHQLQCYVSRVWFLRSQPTEDPILSGPEWAAFPCSWNLESVEVLLLHTGRGTEPWTRSRWGFIQLGLSGSCVPVAFFVGACWAHARSMLLAVAGPCRSNNYENTQDFYFVQVYFIF